MDQKVQSAALSDENRGNEVECVKGFLEELTDCEYQWFRKTVDLARLNLLANEVPVACIVVHEDEIIGTGKNEVNATKNPARHAEMCAIDEVTIFCKRKGFVFEDILKSSTLYVTMEPCVMCASALRHVGVKKVIAGCQNDRFGGCGSVYDLNTDLGCYPNKPFVYISGIDSEECVRLMKEFYATENPHVPADKSAKRNKNRLNNCGSSKN